MGNNSEILVFANNHSHRPEIDLPLEKGSTIPWGLMGYLDHQC